MAAVTLAVDILAAIPAEARARHRASLAAHTSVAQELTVSAVHRASIPAALEWLRSGSRQ